MNTIKFDHGNALVVAHRGLSGIERENTNAAFVAAQELAEILKLPLMAQAEQRYQRHRRLFILNRLTRMTR